MNTPNSNDKVSIARRDLQAMVEVLKSLEVNGYNSMRNLVVTVDFLEGKLREKTQMSVPPKQAPQKTKVVDHEFGPRLVESEEEN